MADARLQSHWLNNPEFDDLSDAAWRVLTGALMWSNGRGTDGIIPARYLRMLHPDGEQPEAFRQLEVAGLWIKTATGYQLIEWVKLLGQSTADTVEHNKEMNRIKQQKWRDEQSKKAGKTSPSFTPTPSVDVTDDVTGYVTGHVGQDKTETETAKDVVSSASEEVETVNQRTGEVSEPVPAPAGHFESYIENGTRKRRRVA
ncbi:hypothetical protein [Cryobacterium sp. PH31-O1]|uniref:hypothetical protein n=1 Tax=Cryobacterium sp. PH31-O1 TaxID=3046306 RepID=UPI0024BAC5ED|nr:hypothetical protein [Cryobacterium sp. PH31-O1]MDJ0337625.1 hypothetical protein [Cryobacterium sp. PH31-O1]